MELSTQEKSFKTAIDDLKQILGTVMVLESFVSQSKVQIDNDKRIGHDLIVGSLSFRNITAGKNDPNLYLTDSYVLDRSNLNEEVDMILSRESLFQIAQAYELLETFLYDIVADFILIKGGLNIFIDNSTSTSDFQSIRKALKSLNDRQNNKHLIGLIRANCAIYRSFEKNNIYDFDFSQWYHVLGDVRHCITHNRMIINTGLKTSLPKYFKDHINTKSQSNKEYLFATPTMCRNLLSRIADFTFFCYKSISEASYKGNVDFQNIDFLFRGFYTQPDLSSELI